MQPETNMVIVAVSILCSAGFGMIVTAFALRKKTKTEIQLFNTEIYSTMLGDLRAQINLLGDQLKNQAQQILNLQKKEIENIKIIKDQQKRESEHLERIKELETTIKLLEAKVAALQNQQNYDK
jgi:chromosome segregation ATPase